MKTPEQQWDGFLAKFTPETAALGRAALVKIRRLTPGAIEMVYDNYNALVVGLGPTERASEAILSIALTARGVSLCFLQGAGLPDPDKRLLGSGTVTRYMRLEGAAVLEEPAVRRLIDVALASAKVPLDASQQRRMVIKSVSAKQRPRRPAAGTKGKKKVGKKAGKRVRGGGG